MEQYFLGHCHTDRSNIKLPDCINKPAALIKYALKCQLKGLAITDHEILSSHLKAQKCIEQLKAQFPNDEQIQNFKVALGNEIYLCRNGLTKDNYDSKAERFYHFILIAKDAIGHQQLRELSTRAWKRSWIKFIRRTPTYYNDIEEIIGRNPGHVIASTACIGGFLGVTMLQYGANRTRKAELWQQCMVFVQWCNNMFGYNDFYLELQPSRNEEQLFVNHELVELAKQTGNKIIITTDAHYLRQKDRPVHTAFLKSKEGERETDGFYDSTYVMTAEEIHDYLDESLGTKNVSEYLANTMSIYNKCEDYSLKRPFKLPYMPLDSIEKRTFTGNELLELQSWNMPLLYNLSQSEYPEDIHLAKRIYLKGPFNQKEKDRIEIEVDSVIRSSDSQNLRWSRYFLQVSDYIKLLWEKADTIVGPGRGSGAGFYLNYLLDIIQVNPLNEVTQLYYWRFLNPERASILDIDTDIEGTKRDRCIQVLQEQYGKDHVIRVLTEGTEKAKSAIQTAARGLGIDIDVAQYLSSMIEAERGLQRTLSDTFYGDEEKGFAPNSRFVTEMTENYPELWEIAQSLEGVVSHVGIHAGGVIIVDEDFTNTNALMTTTKGEFVSQFDLHDSEELSNVKIDMLAVEALDKIHTCLDLLLKYGYLKDTGNLRTNYENAIGVYNIDRTKPEMWELVQNNKIISLFQMEENSGIQGIALTKPASVDDLATLNSVIRLMASEKGQEQPLNKYARFRFDPICWELEMDDYGLSLTEKDIIRSFLATSCGICQTQEQMMALVQHPKIAGWSLAQSDKLRKAVAKKSPKDYAALEKEFFTNAREKNLSEPLTSYVWNVLVNTQRGYGFCAAHALSYSLVALQEMQLCYKYPTIFWNTANLIVDSGAAGTISYEDEEVDIINSTPDEEIEEDDDDEEEVIKEKVKNTTVDYGKISVAIGKMKNHGINVGLPNINKSTYTFVPIVEENIILYGIKGITRLGDALVKEIIAHRPYVSLTDFMQKVKVNKLQIINLIKSGAFDDLYGYDRVKIMNEYLTSIADTKTKLTLQNMPSLIKRDLIPESMDFYRRLFNFNKYLKTQRFQEYYTLDDETIEFYNNNFDLDAVKRLDEGKIGILQKNWDKTYAKRMDAMRAYLKDPNNTILQDLNHTAWVEVEEKYAHGNISHWEMQSLGFYFHEHELAHVDKHAYDIDDFASLSPEPIVANTFQGKNGVDVPIFQLFRIAGTIIKKDKTKHQLYLLTESGVVIVKIWPAQFTRYDKQISIKQDDGTKKIMERSWFSRGNMLLLTGIRRGDNFVPKTYRASKYKDPILLIKEVDENGYLQLAYDRYGED